MYEVREILEIWKIQGEIKKMLKSEKSQGNSFSANLRCLSVEILLGELPSDRLKILATIAETRGDFGVLKQGQVETVTIFL